MDLPVDGESAALCFSKTGQYHASEGMECEDTWVCVEKQGFRFYGLADGQSGKRYCKLGGETVLRAIAQFIEQKTVQAMIQYAYVDEMQYQLIRTIRETIARLCEEYQAAAADFSSTILAVAIDPDTREYLSIHLGDGTIIGVRSDKVPVMLSAPENGITRQYTWLTSSPNAMQHLRIRKGSADHIDRLVLLTDGATMLCRGRYIARKAETILCDMRNRSGIAEAIQNGSPQDDASCVVIDF